MKQVFNKITEKFEMMHHSTADILKEKGKVEILADDSQLKVLILKDVQINGFRCIANTEKMLSVVDAHKWADHGYVKILGKEKVENKLDKTQPVEKVILEAKEMKSENITKKVAKKK